MLADLDIPYTSLVMYSYLYLLHIIHGPELCVIFAIQLYGLIEELANDL